MGHLYLLPCKSLEQEGIPHHHAVLRCSVLALDSPAGLDDAQPLIPCGHDVSAPVGLDIRGPPPKWCAIWTDYLVSCQQRHDEEGPARLLTGLVHQASDWPGCALPGGLQSLRGSTGGRRPSKTLSRRRLCTWPTVSGAPARLRWAQPCHARRGTPLTCLPIHGCCSSRTNRLGQGSDLASVTQHDSAEHHGTSPSNR